MKKELFTKIIERLIMLYKIADQVDKVGINLIEYNNLITPLLEESAVIRVTEDENIHEKIYHEVFHYVDLEKCLNKKVKNPLQFTDYIFKKYA